MLLLLSNLFVWKQLKYLIVALLNHYIENYPMTHINISPIWNFHLKLEIELKFMDVILPILKEFLHLKFCTYNLHWLIFLGNYKPILLILEFSQFQEKIPNLKWLFNFLHLESNILQEWFLNYSKTIIPHSVEDLLP